MDKIHSYKLVKSDDADHLEKTINNYITEGWQPYGNTIVYFYTKENLPIFVQPLVMYFAEYNRLNRSKTPSVGFR
jgi:hypothetical protein